MSPLTKNFKSLTNNKVSLSSNGSCGSAVEPASCYQKELKCPRYWTPNCWWAGRHHQCVNVCEMLNVLNVNVTLRWTWSELIRLSSPQVNNTHTHTHTHDFSHIKPMIWIFSTDFLHSLTLSDPVKIQRSILSSFMCLFVCVCVCVCLDDSGVCACVWGRFDCQTWSSGVYCC